MNIPRRFNRRRDKELDEELQSHLRMAIQDRVERGEPRENAAAAARREFGNVGLVGEVTRDMWGWGWLESLARDVQYAFRGLLHNRTYALAAVVTLALGIGANTAIFSLLDSLVLRALPVREPERLVLLADDRDVTSEQPFVWTFPLFEEIRRRRDVPAEFCAWSTTRFDVARSGETEMVDGLYVSGRFYDVLGVSPVLGRTFREADDRRGGGLDGPTAVISHEFWQRRFGGAPDVVDKTLTLNRLETPFRIIGVTPPGFHGPVVGRRFDVAVTFGTTPLLSPGSTDLDSRTSYWLQVMARLQAGRTPEAATTALRGAQPQIREATMPEDWTPEERTSYLRRPFTLRPAAAGVSSLRSRFERPLAAVMVIVALVLLVACANVTNLQLARIASRRRELAVRAALGASRLRLARQFFAESLLLATSGAALGLLFARWGSDLLVRQLSTSFSTVFLDLSLNWRLLGFVTAVGAGTVVLFGTMPALRASGSEAGHALQDGRSAEGSGGHAISQAFVVAQVALSITLVVAAGLFVRSFAALATRDTGLDADRVLMVNVRARPGAIAPGARDALGRAVAEALKEVPGVERVSFSAMVPFTGAYSGLPIEVPGTQAMSRKDRTVHVNAIGPGWFATFGIPILAGRDFSVQDASSPSAAVIVNRALTTRFFGQQNPLGRAIRSRFANVDQRFEIIGVVDDALYNDVRASAPPTMYKALPQPGLGGNLLVRCAHGAAAALTPRLVSAITAVNPALSATVRTVDEYANAAMARERLIAALSGFFGVLALVLAGVGVFGVTAHAVRGRHAEIGLRIALGASSGGVVRLVLGRVTALIALGIAVGGAASFWASRLVGSLLFGIAPRDPATFVGAAIVLAFVGMVAGAVPAWRAARVDPTTAMRSL